MHEGAKWLGVSATLAVAACASQPGKLTIRSTGKPMAAEIKPVSSRVADGRSQFALGNVALALESFRRAVREEPGNVDAIVGVAACYDRMGRFELSRQHYEAALAVEPGNTSTLAAFAASLHLQGKMDEEASVRGEIRQRLENAQPTAPAFAAAQLAPTKSSGTFTGAEALAFGEDDVPLAPTVPVTAPAKVRLAEAVVKPVRMTQAMPTVPAPSILPTAPASSITITLPPARPVSQPVVKQAVAPVPVRAPKPTALAKWQARVETGPRLERTSMAEVTLVTRHAEPMQTSTVRLAQIGAVRFVPLREAQGRVPVRVLNAARVDRLAANTRSLMVRRGWTNIVIGNATARRARSIVLYPAQVRQAALRLAAQLGFSSAQRPGKGAVTILLGSDAAAVVRRRAAS